MFGFQGRMCFAWGVVLVMTLAEQILHCDPPTSAPFSLSSLVTHFFTFSVVIVSAFLSCGIMPVTWLQHEFLVASM